MYLANVTRKKYKKEETKTNKRQCPFNSVQVKIREGSPDESNPFPTLVYF